MESIQSKSVKLLFRLIGQKKKWRLTGEALKRNISKKQSVASHQPPKSLQQKYRIVENEKDAHTLYVMEPKQTPTSKKHILFLHGGGFVYEIISFHWKFLAKLAGELNCTITIPIYHLAPKHQYQEAFDLLLPVYQELTARVSPKDMVLMGDSAGGGMALALALLLKEKKLPQPANIILISPHIDIALNDPLIQEIEKYDPILAAPGGREVGRMWAGAADPKNYLVSPIYGVHEGLGKISIFIGTHDILMPDCRRFKKIAAEKGIALNYYEYPNMIHDWPLITFLPEAQKALGEIRNIIQEG
jgi:acetyl esterase/lipase